MLEKSTFNKETDEPTLFQSTLQEEYRFGASHAKTLNQKNQTYSKTPINAVNDNKSSILNQNPMTFITTNGISKHNINEAEAVTSLNLVFSKLVGQMYSIKPGSAFLTTDDTTVIPFTGDQTKYVKNLLTKIAETISDYLHFTSPFNGSATFQAQEASYFNQNTPFGIYFPLSAIEETKQAQFENVIKQEQIKDNFKSFLKSKTDSLKKIVSFSLTTSYMTNLNSSDDSISVQEKVRSFVDNLAKEIKEVNEALQILFLDNQTMIAKYQAKYLLPLLKQFLQSNNFQTYSSSTIKTE